VFQGVETGAGREHPAAKQPQRRFAGADFPHIEERGAFWGFFGRALVAGAHDDFQGAEPHHVAKICLQRGHPRGDFVQALQNGGLIRLSRSRTRSPQQRG